MGAPEYFQWICGQKKGTQGTLIDWCYFSDSDINVARLAERSSDSVVHFQFGSDPTLETRTLFIYVHDMLPMTKEPISKQQQEPKRNVLLIAIAIPIPIPIPSPLRSASKKNSIYFPWVAFLLICPAVVFFFFSTMPDFPFYFCVSLLRHSPTHFHFHFQRPQANERLCIFQIKMQPGDCLHFIFNF